jgi:hypothetical protein
MTVQIEITESKVFDQDGKPIPVGTILTVQEFPEGWRNKCQLLASSERKTLTVGRRKSKEAD